MHEVTMKVPEEIRAALVAVMKAVPETPCSGEHGTQGWKYPTPDDVAGSIRPLLAQHDLVIIPEVTSIRPVDGTAVLLVDMRMSILGPKGTTAAFWWGSMATLADGQDTAVSHAVSSGLKTFVQRLFMLVPQEKTQPSGGSSSGRAGSGKKGVKHKGLCWMPGCDGDVWDNRGPNEGTRKPDLRCAKCKETIWLDGFAEKMRGDLEVAKTDSLITDKEAAGSLARLERGDLPGSLKARRWLNEQMGLDGSEADS